MGNIRAAIALYDGVTSPLQSMHKAMGVVLNTFEAMQQASGLSLIHIFGEGSSTPEQRLNSLIDYLINGRIGEIYRYRRLVW